MDNAVRKAVSDIKSLEIQGARNIALSAIVALESVAKKRGFGKEFFEAAEALENSRKTAVPLYNVLEMAKREKSLDGLEEIREFLKISMEKTAKNGAKVIKDDMIILTHCHSSETILAMKYAKKEGKKFKVIVSETRPKLQGLKTAKELLAAKIPVEYIVDSAAGTYMKDADIVLLGCDAIRQEGIYNKIGTYLVALSARENNVPVYFVGDSLKIDRRSSIEIEMRPEEEIISPKALKGAKIISFRSASLKAFEPGLKILNPAFDCTPWKLVSGIVTEKKIFMSWAELNSGSSL